MIETKTEARRRNRKALKAQGIIIGCHHVTSAKAKNRTIYEHTGVCLACGEKAGACKCDDRSEWMKKRNSS